MPHAHHVFFQLMDGSAANSEKLVRECYELLEGHEGVIAFSAGTRTLDCARDVNDLNFHVSLYMLFTNKTSHDAYQTAPRHLEFIARNSASWKTVRVFDSTVPQTDASAR